MQQQEKKRLKLMKFTTQLSFPNTGKEWQKALEEEKLPWNQYLATPELSKNTRDDYDLTSIPTFLVIDPEGKIIFSGHNTIFINQDLRRIQKTLLYKILTRNVKPDKIISNNKLIIDYYF